MLILFSLIVCSVPGRPSLDSRTCLQTLDAQCDPGPALVSFSIVSRDLPGHPTHGKPGSATSSEADICPCTWPLLLILTDLSQQRARCWNPLCSVAHLGPRICSSQQGTPHTRQRCALELQEPPTLLLCHHSRSRALSLDTGSWRLLLCAFWQFFF